MAGTNKINKLISNGPCIILKDPQLPENIGMCARSMLNYGFSDLRIVNPKKAFPNYKPVPCDSFEEVFKKTENKETEISLIPIENSQAGRVADIHNLLPMSNLAITGEYFHKVSHHLLGCPGSSLDSIKTAESHLHALAQCKDFLSKNGIKPIISADTAGAAEEISKAKNNSRAAIASELANFFKVLTL